VLNGVLADLERQLVAPFKEDYYQVVNDARDRLAGLWEYPTLKG
jgi:hypothetical protein